MIDRMNFTKLPENLLVLIDGEASEHKPGLKLLSLSLISTNRNKVDLSMLKSRQMIIIFPISKIAANASLHRLVYGIH